MLCYALVPKTLHELVGLWLILPWDHHFYYWRLYFARIKDIVCSGQFWAHTCLSLAQQNTIFSSSHRLIGFVGLPCGICQPDKPTTVVNYKLRWLIMTYVTLLAFRSGSRKKRYEMFYQYSLRFYFHGYCIRKGNPCILLLILLIYQW